MKLALVGAALSRSARQSLDVAGIEVAAAAKAHVHLVVGERPPSRAPSGPWLWCATKSVKTNDAASAVLAGAYDVVTANAELGVIVKRRLDELSVALEPGPPPVGFIAESARGKQFVAE